MNYIVCDLAGAGLKSVVAIGGSDSDAQDMIKALNDSDETCHNHYEIKSLHNILREKISISKELAWIVESDRKHQEREVNGRIDHLCDENALSFKSFKN